MLYRANTGMRWPALPERFGPWKSVYNAGFAHRDRPDRAIVIAKIGIVITGSERSDVS